MNRAIFMDRDGVINKLLPGDFPDFYVTRWEQFDFLQGVFDAFRLIRKTDYIPIVISNQQGIGLGYATEYEVRTIFFRMSHVIYVESGMFPDFYFCPHDRDAGCACRKPSPGMLYKAAIEHEIDLSKSWMVGDSDSDIEAGYNAGLCPGSLLLVGGQTSLPAKTAALSSSNGTGCPVMKFGSLLQAVEFIMENISAKETEKK